MRPAPVIEAYNRDDCLSTMRLRDWLEALRAELVGAGHPIPRPEPKPEEPSEAVDEQQQRVQELYDRLAGEIPPDPNERTEEEQGRWLLANMLDWHRREQKASWWEYFRLRGLARRGAGRGKGCAGRAGVRRACCHTEEERRRSLPLSASGMRDSRGRQALRRAMAAPSVRRWASTAQRAPSTSRRARRSPNCIAGSVFRHSDRGGRREARGAHAPRHVGC